MISQQQKKAMDYLLENKHKKIGILGGDINLSHTSQQRYLGCLESFKMHGLEFDKDTYYENCRFSFDSAYRAMVRLLEKAPDITAVFAMADVTAIGAIRALKDKGFNVPEDISVIGFDGIELADYYNPKLTTIKQPARELAIRGVEILFNFIDFHAGSIHETVSVDRSQVKVLKISERRRRMRSSGVLMHLSSLPSPYGIGTMGKQAKQFVDFFRKGRADLLADASDLSDQLWRFSIPVTFRICRKTLILLIWISCVQKNF